MGTGAAGNAKQQTTDRLIEQYRELVEQIARHYRYKVHGLDLDDLMQEGMLGLIQAAEKCTRGSHVSTYAPSWIRQGIARAIARQTRVLHGVHLPISMWYGELRRLAQAQERLWQHGREPSLDELAECTGYEKQRLLLLLQAQQEPVSLEQPVFFENESYLLGSLLEAPDNTEQREQQAVVANLLKHLSPQERQVIELRYQLGAEAEYGVEHIPLPWTVVGRRLGMTADLVQTVEARAFVKMRFWAERGHVFVTGSAAPTLRTVRRTAMITGGGME